MKNKALGAGLNANKALSFASCFISILAMRLVLYFLYSTRGSTLTYMYCAKVQGNQATHLHSILLNSLGVWPLALRLWSVRQAVRQ